MAKKFDTWMGRVLHRGAVRHWARAAHIADDLDLNELRVLRRRACQLQRRLGEVTHVVDSRLTLPLIGSTAVQKPMHSDWAFRPQMWRGPLSPTGRAAVQSKEMFGDEVTIFHDCNISELTVRQVRNTREEDLAPFGVQMDVFRFDGSFLSLVVDLPEQSVAGLKQNYLVRMDAIIEMEKPLEIFARLNIKHGPNTEQIVRELPLHEAKVMVEFDLAYTKLNEKRVEKMWVDLIFEGPQMNQITLRDVTFSRRPRAEL